MDSWHAGVAVGFIISGLIATLLGVLAVRRFVALERRTRESERLAELGLLTGGLAHEIKNPLSTIQLNLQLLQEDLPNESAVGSRVHNRMKTIRSEASRLREILDDFLRYAGKMNVEKLPADLNEIVEQIGDFFSPQAGSNGVRLRVTLSLEPANALVDANLIKQALLNLLLNATQAMGEGGELLVRVSRAGAYWQISVTDTGPGIEPEKLPNIFQAYYTTRKGGTGLGLPMTKRIIDEHGGKLSVQSEVGKGSVFVITLPVKGN